MVLVPVTVTDYKGKTIEGLRAENFSIFDDQKTQRIVSFASEDAACSVGLVLDISGSMQNTLSATKNIARTFFQTANPDDEFPLLTVSTQPVAKAGFTRDVAAVEETIALIRPGGLTALIDTVYLSLSRMREASQLRRALLILSDGIDNHSRYSEKELIRVAQEADVQIYSLIIDNPIAVASSNKVPFRPSLVRKPTDRADERQGPELLEKLSDKTGGLHFRVRDEVETKEAVTKAGRALRSRYLIGYQPPTSGGAGKWHRVRVKSDVPGVNVHARNGYYSPD
jgi:Ca-activated chloride channel family protein